MEENEELFDNDCQEPMAPAIIEKSIIIDFSHKILLSSFYLYPIQSIDYHRFLSKTIGYRFNRLHTQGLPEKGYIA